MNKMQCRVLELWMATALFLFCIVPLKAQWSPPDTLRFLALGDSYTIGQGVPVQDRWPFQLGDSLQSRGHVMDTLHLIATTGWRTDHLLQAISGQSLEDRDYTMVSLLIGVNNQYQNRPIAQFRPELEALIDSALRYVDYDTSSLFVLSIPDYAYTPFGQQGNPFLISQQIDQYNLIKEAVCDSMGITFFSITDISRQGLTDPNLVAGDQLHPSGLQYSLWVKRILAYVDSVGSLSVAMDHSLLKERLRVLQGDGEWLIDYAVAAGGGELILLDAWGRQIDRRPLSDAEGRLK